MATQMINVRLGEKLISEVDNLVKVSTYNSRTEFIRESVRIRLDEMNKQAAIASIRSRMGQGKGKEISDEEFRKIREQVFNKILKEKNIKL